VSLVGGRVSFNFKEAGAEGPMEGTKGRTAKGWLNRDAVSSVFWMSLGAVFAVGSFRYGVIKSGAPGPGFVPFLAGVILLILSAAVLVSAVKKGSPAAGFHDFFPEYDSPRRFLVAVLALPIYVLGMMYVGCLLTSFLFLLFFLKFTEPRSWTVALTIAGLGAGTIYGVFVVMLKIPFPKGPLGF
jgi:putative tricarboxylic transport membrane protein